VSFATASFETVIPDIHDGDFSPTASRVADAPNGTQGDSTPSDHSPDASHVDHCTHGHTASAAFACEVPSLPVVRDARPADGAATLISVVRAPHSRPPIA